MSGLIKRSIQSRPFSIRRFKGEIWTIAAAVVLGAALGLFVNGYWLVDLLPFQSRVLLAVTLAVGGAGALGYVFLLTWVRRQWRELSIRQRGGLAMIGLLAAGFVFFGGTSQWRENERYIGFLLPRHQLELRVVGATPANSPALTWFNTSVGDVSFGALETRGWLRKGEQLVIDGASDNALHWTGVTGEQIQMVFEAASPGGRIVATWDGQEESLDLPKGKTTYQWLFPVPYYASRGFIVELGLLNFFVLSLGIMLFLRPMQAGWRSAMEQSVPGRQGAADRQDLAAVVALMVLALSLRGFNLGTAFPAVDEYYHLIAAQQLAQGAAMGAVYQRGLWLVTLPMSLALRVFGHQLWAARMVGVLFNTLAIIPLYLLVRKINRPIAILACTLYSISPWIITFARVAREYAVYPFYFYWIVYGMIVLVEAVPAGFVFMRDWKRLLTPGTIVLGRGVVLSSVLWPHGGLALDIQDDSYCLRGFRNCNPDEVRLGQSSQLAHPRCSGGRGRVRRTNVVLGAEQQIAHGAPSQPRAA